jgi:hypothetical protein
VKAIHRANLDTVGQFALDAALGYDKGHKGGPGGSMVEVCAVEISVARNCHSKVTLLEVLIRINPAILSENILQHK